MLYPVLEHTLNGLKQSAISDLMTMSKATVSVRLHKEMSQVITHPGNADIKEQLKQSANAYDVRAKKDLWSLALTNALSETPRVTRSKRSNRQSSSLPKVVFNLPMFEITRKLTLKHVKDPKTIFNIAYELGAKYRVENNE